MGECDDVVEDIREVVGDLTAIASEDKTATQHSKFKERALDLKPLKEKLETFVNG